MQHGRWSRQDAASARAELGGPGAQGAHPSAPRWTQRWTCPRLSRCGGRGWVRPLRNSTAKCTHPGLQCSLLPASAHQGSSVHRVQGLGVQSVHRPGRGAQGGSSAPGSGARWGWWGWAARAGCKAGVRQGALGSLPAAEHDAAGGHCDRHMVEHGSQHQTCMLHKLPGLTVQEQDGAHELDPHSLQVHRVSAGGRQPGRALQPVGCAGGHALSRLPLMDSHGTMPACARQIQGWLRRQMMPLLCDLTVPAQLRSQRCGLADSGQGAPMLYLGRPTEWDCMRPILVLQPPHAQARSLSCRCQPHAHAARSLGGARALLHSKQASVW